LTIAIAPALGYLVAFLYQVGYSQRLQIPTEFIDVGLRDILVATVGIGLLLLNVMSLVDVSRGWLKIDRPGKRRVFRIVIVVVLFGIPLLLMALTEGGWAFWFVALVVLLLSLDILVPLWTQRHTKGFWNKMEADRDSSATTKQQPLVGQLSDRYGMFVVYIFIAIFVVFFLSYAYGVTRAGSKVNYLTLPSSREVVLAIYSDKAVVAPYSGHRFSRAFRIVKLGDDPTDQFRVQRVGPLKAKSLN